MRHATFAGLAALAALELAGVAGAVPPAVPPPGPLVLDSPGRGQPLASAGGTWDLVSWDPPPLRARDLVRLPRVVVTPGAQTRVTAPFAVSSASAQVLVPRALDRAGSLVLRGHERPVQVAGRTITIAHGAKAGVLVVAASSTDGRGVISGRTVMRTVGGKRCRGWSRELTRGRPPRAEASLRRLLRVRCASPYGLQPD